MYELPDALNNKFFFYLNILPVAQDFFIYCLFLSGLMCLVWSIIKILTFKTKNHTTLNHLLQAEKSQRINYYNNKQSSMKTKEIDLYFNDLLGTKEEETISYTALEELANLKEEIV